MLNVYRTLTLLSKLLSVSLVLALLSACGAKVKPQVSEPELQSAQEESAPESSAPPIAHVITPSKSRVEHRLLRQAQASFKAGRFTTPVHNNAYDTFHSVLLINPESSQARAGLQAILLRYAELIRIATCEGRLSSAAATLRQAELYYPANALLMDLKRNIELAKATMRTEPAMVQQKTEKHDEVLLSVYHLDKKTPEIKETFQDIAERLLESEESVLIFARSDREGRWIYKQLKQAANGYRVRGDIRISRKPKVRILPPI